MENQLPNDKLDDFLRKSFDEYEEDPASYMWGRIQTDLPPETGGWKLTLRRYALPLAAASMLLLFSATLFWQHLRHTQAIAVLNQRLEKAEKVQTEMAARLAAPAPPVSQELTQSLVKQQHTSLRGGMQSAAYAPIGVSKVPQNRAAADPAMPPVPPVAQPDAAVAQQDQSAHTGKIASLATLSAHPLILNLHNRETIVLSPALITPHREKAGRLYAGLHNTTWWGKESVRSGSRPFKNLHHAKNETADISLRQQTWLKVGKPVTKNVFVESGLGYQQLERRITHKPDLKFRDRDFGNHHGGPPFGLHDFQYTFNTYNGAGEVELRVAEADNNGNIDDNEPLNLEIQAHETARIMSIPLLAGVKAGKSKLKGVFKAGLVANYLVSNKFEITNLSNINDKFDKPQGPDVDVALDTGNKFSFGYLASAGLEYPLGPSMRVVAETAVGGDLRHVSSNPFAAGTSIRSFGLNVGLNYTF